MYRYKVFCEVVLDFSFSLPSGYVLVNATDELHAVKRALIELNSSPNSSVTYFNVIKVENLQKPQTPEERP